MKLFEEFLDESFDITKMKYSPAPTIKYAMIEQGLGYQDLFVWKFEIDSVEFVVFKFTKDGYTEFHFMDWTNDNPNTLTKHPKNYGFHRVFATLAKIIYDIKDRDYMMKVRLVAEHKRIERYESMFTNIMSKWFPEYSKGSWKFYSSETLPNGEMVDNYAITMQKQEHRKPNGLLSEDIINIKKLIKSEKAQ